MIRELEIRDERTAREVLRLQRESYALEAEIIGSDDLPPLSEGAEDLRTSGERFYGYFDGEGRLAGVISFELDGALLDICRLCVDPGHLRRGIARKLLRYVQEVIEEERDDIEEVVVQTGALNEPAKRLYVSEGFVERGDFEAAPGLYVTRFARTRRA